MNDKDKEAFEQWFKENSYDYYGYEKNNQEIGWQSACLHKQKEIEELKAENTELEIKLWQALGTMGYPVPVHIPESDYKCGLCASREVQIIRKDAHQEALLEVIRILSNNRGV